MRGVATVSLVVLLLVSACQAGTSLPEGFEETTVGPVTFGRPSEWEQVPDNEVIGQAVAQFNAPGREGGLAGAIVVFVGQNSGGDFDLSVGGAIAEFRLRFPEFELIDQLSVEVDGADHATLLEYVYETDAGEPARSFDLFARDTGGQGVVFSVAGLDEMLDAAQAQLILDTVMFTS